MIKQLFLIGALLAIPAASAQEEQWQHPDAGIGLTFANNSGRTAAVTLHSQNRIGHRWTLGEFSGTSHKGLEISCKLDESICLGATTVDEPFYHWGVGHDGTHRCGRCCLRCDNRWHSWVLWPDMDFAR